MSNPSPSALRRNLSLYTAYLVGRETYFWMPIFFLYFSSKLGLDAVLMLEAVYYGAVVLLEVPSGYASDRLGRRRTLLASSVLLLASYLLFFWGDTTWMLAVAQVLLAGGLSFASGTDTSFLYDNLHALDRTDEYGDREAKLGRLSAWAMAAGALGGGALGMVGLRWAYFASAVFALLSFGAVAFMVEPPRKASDATPLGQLAAVGRKIREPQLGWLFGLALIGIVLNHVPYEFYQGYLALSLDAFEPDSAEFSPLAAGVHSTAAALIAGVGAGWSVALSRRLGRRVFLLGTGVAVLVVILAMGLVLHPLVVLLLIGRGLPGAMQKPPLREAIAPRVSSELRATFFSVQSLAGRLGFAALLTFLATAQPSGEQMEWSALSDKVMLATAVGAAGLLVLALWNAIWPAPEPDVVIPKDDATP